jgi:biopolymer transport protein ExbB
MTPAAKTTLISGGMLMAVGVAGGVIGTVLGMMRSFQELGRSGAGDPAVLANSISGVLLSSVIGWGIAAFGLIVLIAGIVMSIAGRSPDSEARRG